MMRESDRNQEKGAGSSRKERLNWITILTEIIQTAMELGG
jgi:hypothetical protein